MYVCIYILTLFILSTLFDKDYTRISYIYIYINKEKIVFWKALRRI